MNREAALAEMVDIQMALELIPGDGWIDFLATLPDNRDRAIAEMIRNDRERNGPIGGRLWKNGRMVEGG